MTEAQKRTNTILEVMKIKKYSEGILLQELYTELKAREDFNEVFGKANINDPNQ